MFCFYCGNSLPTGWQVFGICPSCRRCLPDVNGELALSGIPTVDVPVSSTSSSAVVATTSAPLTYEAFLQSYQSKESDRRNRFVKKKRQAEPNRHDVRIQIGRMNRKLQPVRGSRLPVLVSKFAKVDEILSLGVTKLAAHDKKFPQNGNASLRYPDGSVVDTLPEGGGEFNLEEYRLQLGRDFQRIVLFVAVDVEDCDETTVEPASKLPNDISNKSDSNMHNEENVMANDISTSERQKCIENRRFVQAGTPTIQFQKKLLLIGPRSKEDGSQSTSDNKQEHGVEPVLLDDDSDDNCADLPDFQLRTTTNTSSTESSSFHMTNNNTKQTTNTAYDNYILLFDSDTDIDCHDVNQSSSELELHCSSESFDSLSLSDVLQPLVDKIEGESQVIIAHRRFIMSSFRRATSNPDFSFWRSATIMFSGEDADDEGGPRREFFRLLMKEFDEMILTGPTGYRTFTYSLNLYHDNVYKLAGQAVQYSIALGGPGLPVFNGKMFKLMLGQGNFDVDECDIDAITEATPREYLRKIYTANTEEEFQAALTSCADWLLDFSFNVHRLTIRDKHAILKTITVHLQFNRYTPAFEQFKSGMSELWNIVAIHPDVTKTLFVDFNESLKFTVLRKMYDIEWSDDRSNRKLMEQDTIFCWEIFLQKCECDKQCTVTMKDLLVFWTGAESVPPLGFPDRLKIAFYTREVIKMADGTNHPERRLPSSSTCSLTLFLPRGVGQPDEIETMLHDAINLSAGFGKI